MLRFLPKLHWLPKNPSRTQCCTSIPVLLEFDLSLFRLSKSSGGASGGEPSFAEAMAEEYRKYQEEDGITDDELEEFGE